MAPHTHRPDGWTVIDRTAGRSPTDRPVVGRTAWPRDRPTGDDAAGPPACREEDLRSSAAGAASLLRGLRASCERRVQSLRADIGRLELEMESAYTGLRAQAWPPPLQASWRSSQSSSWSSSRPLPSSSPSSSSRPMSSRHHRRPRTMMVLAPSSSPSRHGGPPAVVVVLLTVLLASSLSASCLPPRRLRRTIPSWTLRRQRPHRPPRRPCRARVVLVVLALSSSLTSGRFVLVVLRVVLLGVLQAPASFLSSSRCRPCAVLVLVGPCIALLGLRAPSAFSL